MIKSSLLVAVAALGFGGAPHTVPLLSGPYSGERKYATGRGKRNPSGAKLARKAAKGQVGIARIK